jgi:hypothetical protein
MDAHAKLSPLQKAILIFLEREKPEMRVKQKIDDVLYRAYFGGYSPSAQASLSRAFRRLEERGLIKRVFRTWALTDEHDCKVPYRHGVFVAVFLRSEINEAGGLKRWLKKMCSIN